MKRPTLLPLLMLFPMAAVYADAPIKLSHSATPEATIHISNAKGSISLTAWDRNEVAVDGRLADGAQPLVIQGSADDLSIKVEAQNPTGWFNWHGDNRIGDSTLNVHVPRGAAVDVNSVSAIVGIDGLQGGSISVDSVSGKIRVNAASPSIKGNSVSGSIDLAGHAQSVDLQTVSGDILAPSVGDHAHLQSVSGRIHIDGGPWKNFVLSTVSGDVQIAGDMAPDGTMEIDSMSGDIQVLVPSTLSAAIRASTFSGSLHSDFGNATKSDDGPGSTLQTITGSGSAKMRLETFSGDLRIQKQD